MQPSCLSLSLSTYLNIYLLLDSALGWVKFPFFNVFIIRQAFSHSKVPKQANFRLSLHNSRAEIEFCANFFSNALWQNYRRLRANFLQFGFHVQVLQNITSHYPLKNILFLNYIIASPKSLFLLFCKCAKNAQSHKKIKIKKTLSN